MNPLINYFASLNYWHWWVLALILLILELFVPAAFFVWIGAAAATVGLLLMIFTSMTWKVQFVLFSALSIISIIAGRYYLRKNPTETDQPVLNKRGEQYIGRTFTLDSDITNGTGRVRVDDTYWRIEGQDATTGTRVKVTGVNGATLMVENADNAN